MKTLIPQQYRIKLNRAIDLFDFAVVLNTIKHLPLPVAEMFSMLRGNVRYSLDLDWKSTSVGYPYVKENTLKAYRSFISGVDLDKKVRERFIHQSREELEAKLFSSKNGKWPKKVVYENLEYLYKVRHEGKGLILLTGHFDSSIAGSNFIGNLGFNVNIFYDTIVYDSRVPKIFQAFFKEKYRAMQSTYNEGIFISNKNLKDIYKRLQNGQIFIWLSDVLNLPGRLKVDFLNKQYETTDNALRIALRTNSYIGAYVTIWEGHGRYRTIFSKPELPSQSRDPEEVIQKCYTFLSEFILRMPERWWIADTLVGFRHK